MKLSKPNDIYGIDLKARVINNTIVGNDLIIVGAGEGRAFHPWDDLKPCSKCGGHGYIVGKDGKDYDSGSPYRIICTNKKCRNESISTRDFSCIDDWNEG